MKTKLLILLLLCSSAFGQWRISDWSPNQKPMLGTPLLWQDGLVGSWLFNEGAGGVVYDTSGYGNDVSFVGNTSWIPGAYGPALDFDGSGDYLERAAGTYTQVGDDFTFLIWEKADSGQTRALIHYGRTSLGAGHWSMAILGTGVLQVRISVDGGAAAGVFYEVSSGVDYTDDTWHFVGFTRKLTGEIIGYADGVEVGTASGLSGTCSARQLINDLRIGEERNANDWPGQLDAPQIYDRALTAAEIQRLYMDSFWQYRQEPIWGFVPAAGGGGNPWYYYWQLQ